MCIWRALCTRAIYHMLAIHWHATRSRLREGGINQVCLVLDRLTLIEELSRISGLEKSRIERFVVAITYGTGTKNPDPALQPIVPVGDGMLAVPTFHVTSSNYERNLLSLHARIDPASFNASSFVFERMMTDKLLAPLLTKFPLVKANFKVPDGRKGEEVDVLLVDPPSRTMILLELRWMLAPGDAEEVIKRVRICGEKIDQLRRKVLAARDHFVELTQILKLGDPSGWSVSGIVVIDGFAGAPPQTGFDIPLVPQPVFLAALRNLGEGRYLHQYFASGCWLPEEGRDYLLESRSRFS